MGHGDWVLALVRRDGGHRRLAFVRCIACRAIDARDGRIGGVSLLREDAGTARSGSWPRICKCAHRRGSWMRAGAGDVCRWHPHGPLRLAPLLPRPWSTQSGLADSLDPMGADGDFARGKKRRMVSQTCEAAINVGNLWRALWRELRALLRDHLAAVLSHARAPSTDGQDGDDRRCGIFVLLGGVADLRLALRPLDRRGRLAHAGSQNLCWSGRDRKSTRLNSSHVEISYAVFCLKKKKKIELTIGKKNTKIKKKKTKINMSKK